MHGLFTLIMLVFKEGIAQMEDQPLLKNLVNLSKGHVNTFQFMFYLEIVIVLNNYGG